MLIRSHPQLSVVFALAPSLHSFWSYYSTDWKILVRVWEAVWSRGEFGGRGGTKVNPGSAALSLESPCDSEPRFLFVPNGDKTHLLKP